MFPEFLLGLRVARVEIETPHDGCEPVRVRRRIDELVDGRGIRCLATYEGETLENVRNRRRRREAQDHAPGSQSAHQLPRSEPVEQRKQPTGEKAHHQPKLHDRLERRALGIAGVRRSDKRRGFRLDEGVGNALGGALRLRGIRRGYANPERPIFTVRPDQDAASQP